MRSTILFLVFTAFLIGSCSDQKKLVYPKNKGEQSVKIKYSKCFNIKYLDNYILLNITQPYPNAKKVFQYKLGKNNSGDDKLITTPVNKIVVSSTTHIPMLELLASEQALVGFQNTAYISSPKTRTLIEAGKVRELGKKGALNTEVVLEIHPDLIVGFALSANSKVYNAVEKANIPVILNGDWLEETPLGQAEWIKFFGVLFDKGQQADSIFNRIEQSYLAAKKLADKAVDNPKVLSGAIMSKDIWNLPGGDSYVAQFLKDANANYLWKNSVGKGSLSLSFESVFEKAKDADIWIAPGYFSSKQQMLESNAKYQEFKAFKTGQIYTFANQKGPTGGVLYYELAPTRPDLVLKDVIKILHPELLPEYNLTFFEKMP